MTNNPADQIFDVFEKAMWTIFDSMKEFALNYIFGLLALLFGIRTISGLVAGRFSVLSCVLTIVFGFLAITMGQAFWSDFPIIRQFMH